MITVTLREGAIHNIIHTISKYFDLLHLLRKFGEVMYVVTCFLRERTSKNSATESPQKVIICGIWDTSTM